MGAYESISDVGIDGLEENQLHNIQQNDTNEREDADRRLQQHEQEFMNELHETVIPDENHTSVAMHEMDSHNMCSANSNKNKVTLAALNRNRSEPSEEVDNSKLNITSDLNKSNEIESDLLRKECNLDTHNSGEEENISFKSNKSVVLYKDFQIEFTWSTGTQSNKTNQDVCDKTSDLKTNVTESEDKIHVIKTKQLENSDEKTIVNLEAINSEELNGIQLETSKQDSFNKESSSEIINSYNSNSFAEVNESDNSHVNENQSLVQNLEINKLFNTHANELENTKEHLLVKENVLEIVNITQPYKSSVDQDCKSETLKITSIENTLMVKNIKDKLEKSPEEITIKPVEVPENSTIQVFCSEHETENVGDADKLMIIDENINKDILCIEETIKKIKTDEIELANNKEILDIIEKGLPPETTALDQNINDHIDPILIDDNSNTKGIETTEVCDDLHLKDISSVEVSSKTIKIEHIELANNVTPKTTDIESAEVGVALHINTINERLSQQNTLSADNIQDDVFSIEEPNNIIKIEQIELATIETPKTPNNELAEVLYNEKLNIIGKELSQKHTVLNKNITDELSSIEETTKQIKIEQIELDNNEINIVPKKVTKPIELAKNPNDDILNVKVSDKQIKIETIQLDIDENTNTNLVDNNIETTEVLDINKAQISSKSNLLESNNEEPLKEIKLEPLIIEVDENSYTNIEDLDELADESTVQNINIGFKHNVKETHLNENINDKPSDIKNVSKEIKIESVEVEVNERTNVKPKPTDYEQIIKYNFVKNPFAFLKKIKKPSEKQLKNIQPPEKHFNNNSNWNDVSIKRERIEECFENNPDKNEDILNASLDVNVDNSVASDVDDTYFSQSSNDSLSNSTQITSATSSKYYSIIDLSSTDDFNVTVPKLNAPTTEHNKKSKIQGKWIGRPKGSRNSKPRQKKQTVKSHSYSKNKNQSTNIKKKKPKKSQKYSEKDSVFRSKYISKQCMKGLPKTDIVTRTKETSTPVSRSSETKITSNLIKNNKEKSVNGDFPKPFKLEMTSKTDKNIAPELPKPIVYKMESSEVKPAYCNMRQFQPLVRLKRLKSPELLVPLKVRKISNRRTDYKKPTKPFVRKSTRQHISQHLSLSTTKDQQDFQIQQAYSLHPRIKYNRWSMDQDNPFEGSSRVTSPSESKYFTPQELFTLFHSATPPSHFSGPTSNAFGQNHTKTLLLEIAAERAFINNHLLHFGFSPIHFELFNDINDLNVFLKYLFGHLN